MRIVDMKEKSQGQTVCLFLALFFQLMSSSVTSFSLAV